MPKLLMRGSLIAAGLVLSSIGAVALLLHRPCRSTSHEAPAAGVDLQYRARGRSQHDA